MKAEDLIGLFTEQCNADTISYRNDYLKHQFNLDRFGFKNIEIFRYTDLRKKYEIVFYSNINRQINFEISEIQFNTLLDLFKEDTEYSKVTF